MKNTFIILVLIFGIQNINSEVYIRGDYAPFECKKKPSLLFQKQSTLDVSIISDHDYLNSKEKTEALLSYIKIEEKDENIYIPAVLSTRGDTRKKHCEVKPLRITFLDEEISGSINQKIKDRYSVITDYYNELISLNMRDNLVSSNSIGVSQKNNIFSGLGDDVKIVNHCGKSSKIHEVYGVQRYGMGESSPEKQDQKLLTEYYTYKVLSILRTTSPKVRLANLTYIDPYGKIVETRRAFFREPRNNIAKRCNLEKKTNNENYNLLDKIINGIHLELINAFILNHDFSIEDHNVDKIYNTQGLPYYIPYDFDLAVFAIDIYKHVEVPFLTRETSFDYIKSKIEHQYNRIKFNTNKDQHPNLAEKIITDTLGLFLDKKYEMIDLILHSHLSSENKDIILKRININTSIFKQFYDFYKESLEK